MVAPRVVACHDRPSVRPEEHRVATNLLEVNPERLWDSLERSAEIGRFRDVGLRRLALSADDKRMRDLFVDWARAAGCTVEIDRIGNIFARRAGRDPSLAPGAIG